jgi:glycerophosphoryl diester phosphodiesterase
MTAVWAHRGCTEGPEGEGVESPVENTLEAFMEARRVGADGVELDVRLTADGALAVHHDALIPGVGTIASITVPDLPSHVPLLADVLAVCDGMVVNVEIKNAPQDPGHDPSEAVAALTATAIDEAGWTDRVLVSSFQLSTLRAVQVADARLPLGALWGFDVRPDAALAEAVADGFRAVHPFVSFVTPDLVAEAHGAGLAVNVWTVNSDDDLRAMVALGADTVITDRLRAGLAVAAAGGGVGAVGAGDG